jgi:hypothetical protein
MSERQLLAHVRPWRIPAILAVMSLTFPACSSKPAPSVKASPTVTASPSPPPPSPSPTLGPSPSPSPAASPTRSPSPARSAKPPSAKPAPPPASTEKPVTGAAPQGTYTFDESGLIKTAGCAANNQAPPTPTRLTVWPLSGARQMFDRDQSGALGVGSSSSTVLEYRDDGAYLVSLHQMLTVLLQSITTDFQPAPPVLAIPARPTAGQTWSFTLTTTDGQIKSDTTNKVEALDEPVTLQSGQVMDTVRISSNAHITGQSSQGSLDVNIVRTNFYARDQHLQVKEVTDTSGRVGLCTLDFHIEAVARSA